MELETDFWKQVSPPFTPQTLKAVQLVRVILAVIEVPIQIFMTMSYTDIQGLMIIFSTDMKVKYA